MPEKIHTPEWRAKMLAVAMDSESMFTAIQPHESGLDQTIYVSESNHHPVVVIDTRAGKHFAPDETGIVITIGEMSGLQRIDQWLETNVEALRDYCNGDFDTIDFFKAMRRSQQ